MHRSKNVFSEIPIQAITGTHPQEHSSQQLNTTTAMYKTLFSETKTDNDKQLLYKLDAQLIYADPKGKRKTAAVMKVLLNRRTDLKSEVYQQHLENN